MLGHISGIQEMLFVDGGKRRAFNLILFAGRHSYSDGPKNSHGRRVTMEFDAAADDLLLRMAKVMREEDSNFRPVDAMTSLLDEIEITGYSEYFPQSYRLLSSWMPDVESTHMQTYVDALFARIIDARDAVECRLIICIKDHSKPTSDLLGKELRGFIDDFTKISNKRGGWLPAIDLIIFLGECSYTKMKGLGPLYGWNMK